MRIIRPYGTSATEADARDPAKRRRTLRRKPEQPGAEPEHGIDIEDFVRRHEALVIGQWVSAIDKVAAKPSGEKPSAKQRALRQKLGEAAWRHILANARLPGLAESPALETLWSLRIHPYPEGDGRKGQRVRGRWYRRFAGDASPGEVDADEVVRRIARHLYEHELPIHPELPERKQGRIAHRARSIAQNAPRLEGRAIARRGPQGPPDPAWDRAWEEYAAGGDVARRIREAAEAIESAQPDKGGGGKPRRRWVGLDVAARELYEHWQQVFVCPETGGILSVGEVKRREEQDAKLALKFAIHEEVRAVYRSLLKRHGKELSKGQGQRKGPRVSDVARLLPASMEGLRRVLLAKRANRDTSALIRLGKVIHYEAWEAWRTSERAGEGGGPAYDAPVHVLEFVAGRCEPRREPLLDQRRPGRDQGQRGVRPRLAARARPDASDGDGLGGADGEGRRDPRRRSETSGWKKGIRSRPVQAEGCPLVRRPCLPLSWRNGRRRPGPRCPPLRARAPGRASQQVVPLRGPRRLPQGAHGVSGDRWVPAGA